MSEFVNDQMIEDFLNRAKEQHPEDYDIILEIEDRLANVVEGEDQ